MNDLLTSLHRSTPDRRRLLGAWRDILDDMRNLSVSLTALPDECACGDGAAHLRGTCICCNAPHALRVLKDTAAALLTECDRLSDWLENASGG